MDEPFLIGRNLGVDVSWCECQCISNKTAKLTVPKTFIFLSSARLALKYNTKKGLY